VRIPQKLALSNCYYQMKGFAESGLLMADWKMQNLSPQGLPEATIGTVE